MLYLGTIVFCVLQTYDHSVACSMCEPDERQERRALANPRGLVMVGIVVSTLVSQLLHNQTNLFQQRTVIEPKFDILID